MWSIGCILGELLLLANQNKQHKVLFKGNSCFPLSVCEDVQKNKSNNNEICVAENDQLIKIINVMGSQSESSLEFISDQPNVLEYVKSV